MKQRIAKEMPFVRIDFLGSCWKILISSSSLIINQAHCMCFKDAHFTKAPTTPKCFQITEKVFWLLSVEYCRRSRGNNSFWDHSLLLQSSSFLYGHFLFCKPSVKPCKLSFTICSTFFVCFVCLWHSLHPSRPSTAVRSGSDPGISFSSPCGHPDLIQNLSEAYAQLSLGA